MYSSILYYIIVYNSVYNIILKIPPETIIYVDSERVWCMGEDMDHPKVYYTIPDGGEAVCGYCDIKYRLKKDE